MVHLLTSRVSGFLTPDAYIGESDKMVGQCATLYHCLRSLSWCSGEGAAWLGGLQYLVNSQSWFLRCGSDTPMWPCASDNKFTISNFYEHD